ncbi:MAG: excinuclease ABC subunit UvrA [Clostridiales bacterium]|nr:excinuclease ABC subunit UvrA [Clostridiales bacterium]
MDSNKIIIKGARQHNLKNVDLELPRDKFVVITGLSGSGKSSLAFDTLYAEGQRRYVESLSSYARLFLGRMEKPDVDYIEGLSPAISIDQKTTARNPRSTVGTVTEIYDYLRLLYAKVGVPHCPKCGKTIQKQSIDVIIDQILALPVGTRIQVLAPVARNKKGEFKNVFAKMVKDGFARVRVDGATLQLDEEIDLDKQKKHNIEVVVDRLIIREESASRLTGSVETALKLADGLVMIDIIGGEDLLFSQNYACPDCGINMPELSPAMFSFNAPVGACKKCHGLGIFKEVDVDCIVPDPTKSINEGAIKAPGFYSVEGDTMAHMYFTAILKKYGGTMDTPFADLPEESRHAILHGTGATSIPMIYKGREQSSPFEGLVNIIARRYDQTDSQWSLMDLDRFMKDTECPECKGARLSPESLAVTVGDYNIYEFTMLPISKALDAVEKFEFTEKEKIIVHQVVKEIKARLSFLVNVGLDYLTLARSAGTLSGGEAQRIRLATQIGSGLVGVMYILDEPSIGLHQRDNGKLLGTLRKLTDLGNTVLVVEHDEETIRSADHVVDVGPGAGVYGGEIVAEGTIDDILQCEKSVTGQYLSGKKQIPIPKKRRTSTAALTVYGAAQNNLKNIDVSFPIGVFTCVTGVSGSGKSSLVNHILNKVLSAKLNRAQTNPGKYDRIEGIEALDKVVTIDQSPIGRTPRSNPATYTGLFDLIRDVFAMTKDAQVRGYKKSRFSFNVAGGRCEACQGDGIQRIEMQFLSDVYVTCDVCGGKRYNRETLEVKYKGKNIAEVLDLTVDEALVFFENLPALYKKLVTLKDVGLGYIKLGQPSTTLSGGEAQRVKLATELSRRSTGRTVYILDEPTTGLHIADVHKLIDILQRLADTGNTVIVIEHNLDVIKCADYIIDLGPEGGEKGGTVVATGTPEEVAKCKNSYTGQYLKGILKV